MLWREEVTELHGANIPTSSSRTCTPTTAPCSWSRNPKQFDVIVTDNLFGDILSDEAAMLTGSLGMLPSASLGAPDAHGPAAALLRAGARLGARTSPARDLANPIATLLSFAMMLRYSFDLNEDADMIEQAVQNVLNGGTRTVDIMAPGMARCSTSVMGDSDHPRTGEGGGVSISAVTDKKARRI